MYPRQLLTIVELKQQVTVSRVTKLDFMLCYDVQMLHDDSSFYTDDVIDVMVAEKSVLLLHMPDGPGGPAAG